MRLFRRAKSHDHQPMHKDQNDCGQEDCGSEIRVREQEEQRRRERNIARRVDSLEELASMLRKQQGDQ